MPQFDLQSSYQNMNAMCLPSSSNAAFQSLEILSASLHIGMFKALKLDI